MKRLARLWPLLPAGRPFLATLRKSLVYLLVQLSDVGCVCRDLLLDVVLGQGDGWGSTFSASRWEMGALLHPTAAWEQPNSPLCMNNRFLWKWHAPAMGHAIVGGPGITPAVHVGPSGDKRYGAVRQWMAMRLTAKVAVVIPQQLVQPRYGRFWYRC